MADVTVREATVDDVAGIRRVAERGWRAAYGDLLSEGAIDAALAEWYDPEATRDLVRRDDVACFVADDGDGGGSGDDGDSGDSGNGGDGGDGELIGYVSGGPGEESDVANLGAIYVDPDRWNEGVGTALLSRFESWCLERDRETVEFRVLADNEVGNSFYRARGYEAVAARTSELFGETVEEQRFRGRVDPER